MTERRHFLGCSGLLFASLLQARDRVKPESIIVIGAGIAGLSCARVLNKAGHRVIVLEARDRIGGRIHTHRATGIPLDLGAAWIHGSKQNPITQLAVEAKAGVVESDDEALQLVNSNREILSQGTLSDLNKEYKRVRQSLRQARKQAKPKSSLGDLIPPILESVSKDLREAVRWQIFSEIELTYASDLETLSLAAWDMDEAFEGAELVFSEGCDSVPKYLGQGLDIRLKHVVSAIQLTETGVKIETEPQTFTADRCVVTLPLGVLKAGAVKFSPALPATKRQAIQNLGAGRFCKVAVVFDKVFWPTTEHRFACITAPHFEIWSLWPTHRQPALVLLSSGTVAESWERWKPDEVERETLRLLQRVFNPVHKPKSIVVTQWGVDPYTRGAYTSVAPEATIKDFDTLAAPVANRLFFAGEATSRDYPGTVHGAFLSGVREAERILELGK